jgi:hypothetical protein
MNMNDISDPIMTEVKIQDNRGNCIGVVRKASKNKAEYYCLSDVKNVLQMRNCTNFTAMCKGVVKPAHTRSCWASWNSIKDALNRIRNLNSVAVQFVGRANFEVPNLVDIDIEFKRSVIGKSLEKMEIGRRLTIMNSLYDAIYHPESFKRLVGPEFFELCTVKNLIDFSAMEFSKMMADIVAEQAKAKQKKEPEAAKETAAVDVPVTVGDKHLQLIINLNFNSQR